MAVMQARDGYLWVGTYNGLARFDGICFTALREINGWTSAAEISVLPAD
jgi:ligand-binding sensor domain-containing protein